MSDEQSWWDYEQDIRAEVRDEVADLMGSAYPEDRLHEMADSACPIYTSEIMRLAADNIDLAVSEPEILAFDGTATPVNTIVGNMYEALLGVAYEEWETVKREAWYCQETEGWSVDGEECGHDDCGGSE